MVPGSKEPRRKQRGSLLQPDGSVRCSAFARMPAAASVVATCVVGDVTTRRCERGYHRVPPASRKVLNGPAALRPPVGITSAAAVTWACVKHNAGKPRRAEVGIPGLSGGKFTVT
jgi:hypothetical protein